MNEFLIILFSISISGSILFFLVLLLDKFLLGNFIDWQLLALKILLFFFLLPAIFFPIYFLYLNRPKTFKTIGDDVTSWTYYTLNTDSIFINKINVLSISLLIIWCIGFLYSTIKYTIKDYIEINLIIQCSMKKIRFYIIFRNNFIKRIKNTEKNKYIYWNSQISSPCIVGINNPIILLPHMEVSKKELELILRHELCHYKANDNFYNILSAVFLSIHWFNPTIYIFIHKLQNFCEINCDRNTLKNLSYEERYMSAELLLKNLSHQNVKTNNLYNITSFINFNEQFIKRRIYNIMKMSNKKSILSIITTFILLILCPISVFASSEKATTIYNATLNQFDDTFILRNKTEKIISRTETNELIHNNESIIPELFTLEQKGSSIFRKELPTNKIALSEQIPLVAGKTIRIELMNPNSNGNFEAAVVLNGHVMVSKKSNQNLVTLNYTTKQSGNFAIKITNLASNTILVSGVIVIE